MKQTQASVCVPSECYQMLSATRGHSIHVTPVVDFLGSIATFQAVSCFGLSAFPPIAEPRHSVFRTWRRTDGLSSHRVDLTFGNQNINTKGGSFRPGPVRTGLCRPGRVEVVRR